MGWTNFPNGITSFGIPVMGSGMLPKLGGNAVAYFVDPVRGNDSNDGLTPETALDTITAAYGKAVDTQGDVIYLLNDGNTTGTARETSPLTWAKDNTHLVGLCAPAMISQRARITPVATNALTAGPVITVSGHGNIFANVQIAHFAANTDSIAARGVDVTGSRNYFFNVHIVGISNDHSGDEANAADLYINGGHENLFERCTIGVDTVVRSTTCSNVELVGAATRNIFQDCLFVANCDNAGALFVKVDGSGDIDRFVLFRNCSFINTVESSGTAMTSASSVHNTCGGLVMFHGCQIAGANDVAAADNGNVWVDGVGGAGTGALSIVATQ